MSKIELTKAGNPRLFNRTEVKASVMQAGYGQREKGTRAQLEDDMPEKYSDDMYDIFVQAIKEVVPGFYEIMDFVNELWNPEWTKVTWLMPDGVKVTCKPTNSQWIDFNLFGKYSIKAKVSGVEKEDSALILFVGIIHATDAYMARMMLDKAETENYDEITIHDDFRILPGNAHKTKRHYNEVLASINDSQLLSSILSQITGQDVSEVHGDIDSADILESKYSLS